MRIIMSLVVAAVALSAAPSEARHYSHHRRTYSDCRYDKRNAGHQGIAIGAIAGGAGTALLGGNVGQSVLGAAAGGTAGNFIGRGTEKCSNGRYRR
ncbi:MAG: hypothetical protein ACRYG4_02720 [Janthinobacterium lividum]